MYKIQSILFNKKNDLTFCVYWLKYNNFKIEKVDETEHYYRFRQISPDTLRKQGYKKFITKLIDEDNDIKYIIAYKNENEYNYNYF